MRTQLRYIILFFSAVALFACEKDNYDPPGSVLSGSLVYNGDPIPLEFNQVPFQLFQYGFGKVGPVSNTTFTQDGTYSVLVFDGEYKFTMAQNQGPFLWPKNAAGDSDTIVINLKGSQTRDIEVTPYYMIRNPQFSVASGVVTGTCSLEKIVTDANAKNIERVNLYINKTAFVSGNANYNIGSAVINGGAITDPANISMTVNVPAIVPAQSYVFARIGLKMAGVEDMIFSPVVKLTL